MAAVVPREAASTGLFDVGLRRRWLGACVRGRVGSHDAVPGGVIRRTELVAVSPWSNGAMVRWRRRTVMGGVVTRWVHNGAAVNAILVGIVRSRIHGDEARPWGTADGGDGGPA